MARKINLQFSCQSSKQYQACMQVPYKIAKGNNSIFNLILEIELFPFPL